MSRCPPDDCCCSEPPENPALASAASGIRVARIRFRGYVETYRRELIRHGGAEFSIEALRRVAGLPPSGVVVSLFSHEPQRVFDSVNHILKADGGIRLLLTRSESNDRTVNSQRTSVDSSWAVPMLFGHGPMVAGRLRPRASPPPVTSRRTLL